MPAITPVGASVTMRSTDKTRTSGVGGEAFSAGDVLVRKKSDNRWWKASASMDLSDTTTYSGVGIALDPCDSAGDGASVAADAGSIIDLGAASTKGTHYVVSGTAGVLEEYSDLTVGEYVNYICYGDGTDFIFDPQLTGFTK